MNIDWNRKANAESVGETTSVLLKSRRSAGLEGTFGGLESTFDGAVTGVAEGASGAGLGERERLDRLGEALAGSKPAVSEGQQAAIKHEILAGARSGLAKVNQANRRRTSRSANISVSKR